MRTRPFILRFTAFLLLVVFSQKAGAGLLLHSLFHDNVISTNTRSQEHKEQKEIAYNCSCIDDLSMPFTGGDETVYSVPVLVFAIPTTFFDEAIPFHPYILSLLRGPPAFTT